MEKYFLLLFLVLLVPPSAFASNEVRLNNTVIPLHYDVVIHLYEEEKFFSVDETIEISVEESTNELRINSRALIANWPETQLIDENGVSQSPTEFNVIYDQYSDILSLTFGQEIEAGRNYTVKFPSIIGSYGEGLIEVPFPESSAEDAP